MSNYRFLCNHCGKTFQLETPTAKECPFCFWASSVKREDEAAAEKKRPGSSSLKDPSSPGDKQLLSGLGFLLKSVFFLAVLAGVVFLAYQLYSKWSASRKDKVAISINARSEEKTKINADALVATLSTDEKNILYGEVVIPEKPEPGVEEKKILERTVELRTGWSEKLPSPVWTFAQYQQMIQEQEQFYKIPFARSYRKKLEELFSSKYLPGAEAFTRGDLLQARNFWVESLAFPLYSTDIKKHRAVALTMLKPFINDTIAKIGALNQTLIIKEKRSQEGAVSSAYQALSGLINQQKWDEAIQAIDQLGPAIDQLNAAMKQQLAPPPYPAAVAMVDQDIQRTLADLLVPSPVSVADLLGLKQDLAEKRDILTGLTEKQVQISGSAYQNALVMIQEKQWQEALTALGAVQGPEALRRDAQAKMAVLQKIVRQPLASSAKTR